ncbi:DNA phosphorothioation-dependent restriction protein DptG [Bacillus haynesii]|uniref:DNA phosphorothioation-dependent restriction protein DptG n=1 Tax=Bacillus haynesii TaxID=1925021 RepID=UPI00227FC85A|nr:DNA phosphorothioation-dependent restriction protein DptG [Bacillus haynesii]MCY8101185.1 DNA phosphorothioation-dependent restriction protein DptG [Bacillus haynesii]MCY8470759.1 DNA phosphorothioation-dependent restriction protein DptG [Bacillus haynesii]
MEYRIIDYEQLAKTFNFKQNEDKKIHLQHTSGNKCKLFPYTTKKNEINSFSGVIGEFSRTVTGKKNIDLDKQQLMDKIISHVVSHGNQDVLQSVIDELFFSDQDELVIAHPAFFNYIPSSKQESDLGQFLADILVTDQLKENIWGRYKSEPSNVILKLVYKSLPSLENKSIKSGRYQLYHSHIQNQFENDLSFLLENEKLFLNHFEDLLLYYYFYYITQLVLHFERFFDDKQLIYPVYYNLDWEKKRTKSRISYQEGWKVIEPKISRLFAHVNCLEMINYMRNSNEFISYQGLRTFLESLNEDDKDQLRLEMQTLVQEYKDRVQDINWKEFRPPKKRYDEPLFNEVRSLLYQLDYQFKESGRKRNSRGFYMGFLIFAKQYFLKQSGPLGYTLNLKQDFFIFLTKLCINKREKIALKELFNEFEKRGIYFDLDSKKAIIDLYEKLNLLEKKSDSGDAQYVKYIS